MFHDYTLRIGAEAINYAQSDEPGTRFQRLRLNIGDDAEFVILCERPAVWRLIAAHANAAADVLDKRALAKSETVRLKLGPCLVEGCANNASGGTPYCDSHSGMRLGDLLREAPHGR